MLANTAVISAVVCSATGIGDEPGGPAVTTD
jgi:hypothetical protein